MKNTSYFILTGLLTFSINFLFAQEATYPANRVGVSIGFKNTELHQVKKIWGNRLQELKETPTINVDYFREITNRHAIGFDLYHLNYEYKILDTNSLYDGVPFEQNIQNSINAALLSYKFTFINRTRLRCFTTASVGFALNNYKNQYLDRIPVTNNSTSFEYNVVFGAEYRFTKNKFALNLEASTFPSFVQTGLIKYF